MKKICAIIIAMTFFVSCSSQVTSMPTIQTEPPQTLSQEAQKEYHISEALNSVVRIDRQYKKMVSTQVGTTIKMSYKTLHAYGSAVYIGDGHFLTAAHVAGSEEVVRNPTVKWTIKYKNGQKAAVKLVSYNKKKELALFKIIGIPHKSVTAVKFNVNAEKQLRPGDRVYAIGTPSQLYHTITDGIFTAVRNMKNNVIQGKVIQHSAPINPGNSGGALVNEKGELLGIMSFFQPTRQGAAWSGLGFAVSLEEVSDFLLVYFDKVNSEKETVK